MALTGQGPQDPGQGTGSNVEADRDHTLFAESEIRTAVERILASPTMRDEPPHVIGGLVISIMIERRRQISKP